MILGIGSDLTNIKRIKKILDRYGDRFHEKVFSKNEIKKSSSITIEASTYAKRWAAKEACSKALGTGFTMGINWKDITIYNLESGQPAIALQGQAEKHLKKLTKPNQVAAIHLSLTDDYPWAQAFVVIESLPLE